MLHWGVVGLGRIADTEIAPAIAASPHGILHGVVSRDQGRADSFAERHQAVRALTDLGELLRDPDVDAVYIATPNALHADQVVAAAQAGKHVLCDKPLALTVADAQRAIAACDEAGVRLGVTFQTRFHDAFDRCRPAIRSGSLGDILVAQVEMSPGRTLLRGWRTDPSLAGLGTVNNVGVHGYDLIGYLLGAEVVEVTALVGHESGLVPETLALALLRFDNGALGYVNANQSVPHTQADITIYGTKGRVIGRSCTRPNMTGSMTILSEDDEISFETSSLDAYRRAVEAFEEAVRDGREPSPSGADGLRSVELTTAIAQSIAQRRTVSMHPAASAAR
jgi:1,5-anhydro-D-fructose reductase (1,5-anhydro-D-mannitol-forming)